MRAIPATPIALLAFTCALAVAATAISVGILPENTVALWAAGVMAGEGNLPIESIISAYPSIPFAATTFLELMTPAGTPTPALLSAMIFGLLAGLWFRALRAAEWTAPAATAATMLLVFHPMLLRALLDGSQQMFLGLFLYLFGNALYDLRARSSIPDVMIVGLALLGAAFSHPMGAAFAAAALPFLIFAARPAVAAGSSISIALTLIFPAAFGAAAFEYVSWIFPDDGRRFVTSSNSAAEWADRLAPVTITGIPTLDIGLMLATSLIAAAPIAAVAVTWVYQRQPLLIPTLIFTGTSLAAAVLAVVTGSFGNPEPVTIAAPILAAVVLTRVPMASRRRLVAMLLLVFGFLGSAAALAVIEPSGLSQFASALQNSVSDHERADALSLGSATEGRDGILVDGFNAPAVVLGRNHSSGLLLPASAPFAVAMLFARIEAPFVAVPDPLSKIGTNDRLNKVFPFLYRDGLPGYRLIYQNKTWRLFALQSTDAVYSN